jgi:outer membrane protein TolC
MKPLKMILLLIMGFSALSYGQTDVLDGYVREGLVNNEAIKQQNFNLERSIYALKEATGLFMPSISLKTDYVDSRGGRGIEIPVGDLVNPIYSNLNQINAVVAPGSPQYPTLGNISQQLNPTNFYNAYIRTSLPIVNAEIWYNRKIKKDQVSLQQAEVAIYKRELVKDIQLAYFNYLKATAAISIYENALGLVKESERVNQKLVDNGKEVVFVLSRSKSEVSKIEAQLANAQNTKKNAAAYFNFLLNKPLDSEIAVDEQLLKNMVILPQTPTGDATKREELNKLTTARSIAYTVLNLKKSAWIPTLGAQLDLGSQASDFVWNKKSQYYLFGVSFDWKLFTGLQDVYRVKQAKFDVQALESQTKYVQNQLTLASTTTANSYASALEQYKSAITEESTSAQYFNLINKRYKEGQALYIEFLDARNENTLASLKKSITYFDAWIKYSESVRATAQYNINK